MVEDREELEDKLELVARELLAENDFAKLFNELGVEESKSCSEALKVIVAKRITEYIIKAQKIAKKKNMNLGPAALILADNDR